MAAGINYTLRTETNDASVLSQSYEIKKAIPEVVEQAKKAGYNINKMAVAGGSAGHTLAMIYAYRDGKDADVPVIMTYGSVVLLPFMSRTGAYLVYVGIRMNQEKRVLLYLLS